MDTPVSTFADSDLYQRDFQAWCVDQAARLRELARRGGGAALDYENLAEEIESLGRSDRRGIKSHMRVLLARLLKWRHQPERRGASWQSSIANSRTAISDILADRPSLVAYANEIISEVYASTVSSAATETGLPHATFPANCPFSNADVLDLDFFPAE